MKKYFVYIDYGKNLAKEAIVANNENEAVSYFLEHGDVVGVKDITSEYPISAEKLAFCLEAGGFGRFEIDMITRFLQQNDVAR